MLRVATEGLRSDMRSSVGLLSVGGELKTTPRLEVVVVRVAGIQYEELVRRQNGAR